MLLVSSLFGVAGNLRETGKRLNPLSTRFNGLPLMKIR